MTIPIVIFHLGNQQYFTKCVELNSIKNKVYVIGDETSCGIFHNNVQHFNISNMYSEELEQFKSNFINYSTNHHEFELFCFCRMFYIKKLMEMLNIEQICHLDSDCVLLESTDYVFKNIQQNAFMITNRTFLDNKNIYNTGSVHSSLLNIDFLNKFVQLCLDIYVNKSKFYLIEPKINYFTKNNLPGGVCDMTLYYLLYLEKMIDVFNLFNFFDYNGESSTLDDNINSSESYLENVVFIMNNNNKKAW